MDLTQILNGILGEEKANEISKQAIQAQSEGERWFSTAGCAGEQIAQHRVVLEAVRVANSTAEHRRETHGDPRSVPEIESEILCQMANALLEKAKERIPANQDQEGAE